MAFPSADPGPSFCPLYSIPAKPFSIHLTCQAHPTLGWENAVFVFLPKKALSLPFLWMISLHSSLLRSKAHSISAHIGHSFLPGLIASSCFVFFKAFQIFLIYLVYVFVYYLVLSLRRM